MRKLTRIFLLTSLCMVCLALIGFYPFSSKSFAQSDVSIREDSEKIVSHIVNPKKQDLRFFSKDEEGTHYVNHNGLKECLAGEDIELVFAMNGGMYNKDLSPQGLYIEKGELITPFDTQQKGYGNFYMQPNGVFYLTADSIGVVCQTAEFNKLNPSTTDIQYATQSGPMLLINGRIHPKFREGSSNVHIRNGVGVLPNGDLLFAMSKETINFYDFASYFKSQGCKNALYLDGFVSRTYLPTKNWEQLDGIYGIIIGEVKPIK